MSEENQDVEVVVEPSEPEITSEEQSPQEGVSKEPAYGSQEYNFRELRKIAEEQQRRIRELEARQNQQQAPVEEEEVLDGDDFLTVKQAEKLALRKAQELIKQQEIDTLEDRTRMKFKDYDDVVTEENVKKLIEDDADLADSIRRASNPYATAYKLIRKTSFHKKEVEEKAKKSSDVEKMQKNSTKPGSANAVTSKPLAQANSFSSMSKAEMNALYQEMQQCASRRY